MRSLVVSVAKLAPYLVLSVLAACASAPPPPPPPPPPAPVAAPSKPPPPKVFGLTEAQFRPVLASMDKEITSCHTLEYAGSEHDGGRIVLDWTIDSSGAVSEVSVAESSFANDVFETCVLAAARKLSFPKTNGATAVRKPFSLHRSAPTPPAAETTAPASP